MPSLTTTTFTVTDSSRCFPARYAGTCVVSGQPFEVGAEGRMAQVNGVKGFITQAGLRLLDVRCGAGDAWVSSYSRNVQQAPQLVANPAVHTIVLITRYGVRSVYTRSSTGTGWNMGWSSKSEKQLLAHAAKSYAIDAQVPFAR